MRWNDDGGSSFRNRDNTSAQNPVRYVKSLFKLLNPFEELVAYESDDFSQSDVRDLA